MDATVDANVEDMLPSRAVIVAPTSGLSTTEVGGTAAFAVSLSSEPLADVTIALVSSATGEGTVALSSLLFTRENWDAVHMVVITGVDDPVADGDQAYTIELQPCVGSGSGYEGLDPSDVSVTNVDDETPGVTVVGATGLITTESGGSDSYTIELNTAPTSDVDIAFASSDLTEVTVSPPTVTFTSLNWNSPRTITVVGVDDPAADGDQAFEITVTASSADDDYAALAILSASGSNLDDESPGLIVTPTTGLTTNESGATAMFTIALRSAPLASVVVPLASSDSSEGTISASDIAFTPSDWNVPQVVVVTGQDDAVGDGDQAYVVQVGTTTSTDAAYDGLMGDNVNVINADNEGAGISTSALSGLMTSEGGLADSFTVVLDRVPTASVVLSFVSLDTTEGTSSPATLTFAPGNWNVPQIVTVNGVDDSIADGSQPFNVRVRVQLSADPSYAALPDQLVAVTNIDDDSPGVLVMAASGLVTSEAGATATFTVVLQSQPTAAVTIPLGSSAPGEGVPSPASLVFTTSTWSIAQTVTVTGVDDFVADGDRAYNVLTAPATSTDLVYSGMDASDVAAINTDDDSVGVLVTPIAGLSTSEVSGTATFTIVLESQPAADVTISLTSSDLTEGTVSPATVTFSSSNWNTPRTITVTGVDDAIADGTVAYTIVTGAASSADMLYAGLAVADVAVVTTDNESAAVVVTPTSGLVTTEAGGTATFSVSLSSEPTADVTITLASSDLTEGTASPATLTFTNASWSIPQVVTVTGVDDLIIDGSIAYAILTSAASSTDVGYNGLVVADVSVSNSNNDVAGISVSPTSGLTTSEAGATAMFAIVLTGPPASDVTISIASSDSSEGVASPSLLTFTAMNWNVAQTVTVTGSDDVLYDGSVAYSIVTGNAVSADPAYSGMVISNVAVTNTDSEGTAGLNVTPISGLVTSEDRGVIAFHVQINAYATASVTVGVSSTDTTEGTVSPASTMMLAMAGTGVEFIFYVTGVDDLVDDGDVSYNINFTVTSADPAYNGLVVAPLTLTNTDNDVGGVIVSPTAGLVVTEMATTTTFQVVLDHAPSADVTIPLSSSDVTEGTVSPATLTFTSANWATPRTVTVTGVADGTLDSDQLFSIVTGSATSADGSFNGASPPDVAIIAIDVETQRCASCFAATYLASNGQRAALGNGISTDGRYVVFSSNAALLASDTNGYSDVYVRDRQTNTLELASVSNSSAQGNNASYIPWISDNGRYVTFVSLATSLVASDTNAGQDIFLRDRTLGTTTLVTLSDTGAQFTSTQLHASSSDDGRYVMFVTNAPAVAGDTNSTYDAFVRDVTLGTTVRASVQNAGTQFPGQSFRADISGDGRYVAFPNGSYVYVRDLVAGTTATVTGAVQPNQILSMSSTGRYIVFESDLNSIVPNDTNGVRDVFLVDTLLATTIRVSVGLSGANANGASARPTVSDDGTRVAFRSDASNLVADDTNNLSDAFVYDVTSGVTTMITRSQSGVPQDHGTSPLYGGYEAPSISGDGRWVVYPTYARNIMYTQFDTAFDVTTYIFNVP
ncbi:MAG: hypothetical protein IPK60_10865 [Sandaracinaceae bacterium]|nr:hypothetical protein [Sandaracinaceae bacterium]